ncbi:ComEC/Rec2 family competence protein [Clostridium acetireducens]|nr:ComEC/Rec2 family competence protein [Clostridium acetireducens]
MNKPIIYYTISLIIGCIFSLCIFERSIILGAAISASFLIIIFCTVDKKYFIIICLFFILGVIDFNLFFNIKVENKIEVRVKQKKDYYCIANYKGRSLLLKGNLKNIEEGQKIKAYGNFQRDMNYSFGSIGNYNIDRYDKYKKDAMYYISVIKKYVYKKFCKCLDKNKSGIIMGVCFGETDYLSKIQKEEFKKLGVIHIISVSGFHMSIIYKALESIFGIKISILMSFIYVIFTGANAATLRAFIMIALLKLANIVFKNYNSLCALSFSALILILIKPFYILNIGFALSFLSTLGIILFNKKLSKILYKLPEKINSSLSLTLSAQFLSFPYICFTIKEFGIGFILGNLLLVPLYSIIIILGNISLMFFKIDFIFNSVIFILNIILTTCMGVNYVLLYIFPNIKYLCYIEGVCLILLYLGYLLYNQGYKRAKYIPIYIVLIFVFENYTLFPEIYYISSKESEFIIFNNKFNSIMFCNYNINASKDVIYIKEKFNSNNVITNPISDLKINLDDKTQAKFYKKLNSRVDLQLNYKNRKYLFKRQYYKPYTKILCVKNYNSINIPFYSLCEITNKDSYNYFKVTKCKIFFDEFLLIKNYPFCRRDKL